MKKRVIFLAAIVFATSVLGGCGKKEETSASGDKLSVWMKLLPVVSYSYKNFGETPIAAELEKRTNTELEFIHPTQGQEKEQFNLMIASKELPDIIYAMPNDFKGGVTQAVEEGIILGLNDYINEEKAPNLTKLIKEDEQVDKSIKLDDGTYC